MPPSIVSEFSGIISDANHSKNISAIISIIGRYLETPEMIFLTHLKGAERGGKIPPSGRVTHQQLFFIISTAPEEIVDIAAPEMLPVPRLPTIRAPPYTLPKVGHVLEKMILNLSSFKKGYRESRETINEDLQTVLKICR